MPLRGLKVSVATAPECSCVQPELSLLLALEPDQETSEPLCPANCSGWLIKFWTPSANFSNSAWLRFRFSVIASFQAFSNASASFRTRLKLLPSSSFPVAAPPCGCAFLS